MNGWHKCFLCDCEYYDESTSGYWGWCRDCRKVALKEYPRKETQKKSKKGITNEIRSKKHV